MEQPREAGDANAALSRSELDTKLLQLTDQIVNAKASALARAQMSPLAHPAVQQHVSLSLKSQYSQFEGSFQCALDVHKQVDLLHGALLRIAEKLDDPEVRALNASPARPAPRGLI